MIFFYVEGSVLNFAEDSFNAIPGLSLSTFAFICIFPGWSIGTCGFCLKCPCFFFQSVFDGFSG